MNIELDPTSPAAVFVRNYRFSPQELADLGAMVLFFEASVQNGVLTAWRIGSSGEMNTVECFSASQRPIVCTHAELLPACKLAVDRVVRLVPMPSA